MASPSPGPGRASVPPPVPPVLPALLPHGVHPLAPRLRPTPMPPPVGTTSWNLDDPTNSTRVESPFCPLISASNPNIFWLNNRPYWVGRLLGRGGFGEVHEVEMLLPQGLEVDWDDDGGLRFDENGGIVLRESGGAEVSESSVRGENAGNEMTEQSLGTETQSSWALSFSMTPSEALWFSLVRREEAAGGVMENSFRMFNVEATPGSEAVAETRESDLDVPVVRYNFLQGSGVFFALKIQKTRNKKHLGILMKEVENLQLLKGKAGIVQLKDHATSEKPFHLIILMELGACDLNEFFKKSQWALDVPSIAQVWRALVDRVESLHESDIIHRDIKPQNFVLVPTKGYSDTRILARTSTRREDFVFRLVQSGVDGGLAKARKEGDVELTIKDTVTGEDVVLLLDIKMTDFGLALPLDVDRDHLSVFGPNGTVVFMAPEAVRQTVSGCRKVSKRADIWALGVILYQMLHQGATPVGHYMTKGGPPEALLAVASETVNREAMDFDASEVWQAERTRLLRMSATDGGSLEEQATTADMVHALVVSWVGSEFFVRVCKRCLVFDADNRVDGDDLRGQIGRAIETGWGFQGDVSVVPSSELLQAAFNIDSKKKDAAVSFEQVVDVEIAQIGQRVGASLFPTVWTDQDPKRTPSTRNIYTDLEAQRNSNDQGCRQPNRLRLFLIVVGLLIIGGLCAIYSSSGSGTQEVDVGPHVSSPTLGPTDGPAAATVVSSSSPAAPAHPPSPASALKSPPSTSAPVAGRPPAPSSSGPVGPTTAVVPSSGSSSPPVAPAHPPPSALASRPSTPPGRSPPAAPSSPVGGATAGSSGPASRRGDANQTVPTGAGASESSTINSADSVTGDGHPAPLLSSPAAATRHPPPPQQMGHHHKWAKLLGHPAEDYLLVLRNSSGAWFREQAVVATFLRDGSQELQLLLRCALRQEILNISHRSARQMCSSTSVYSDDLSTLRVSESSTTKPSADYVGDYVDGADPRRRAVAHRFSPTCVMPILHREPAGRAVAHLQDGFEILQILHHQRMLCEVVMLLTPFRKLDQISEGSLRKFNLVDSLIVDIVSVFMDTLPTAERDIVSAYMETLPAAKRRELSWWEQEIGVGVAGAAPAA